MKHPWFICWIACCAVLSGSASAQRRDYPIRPARIGDVRFTDNFWSRRIEVNRTVTIPFEFRKCEETGRVNNFAIAGGLMAGEQCGIYPFDDSDPYKIIEGASYSLSAHPDSALDRYLDGLIAKIGAAQEKDGYLYTVRTNRAKKLVNWAGPTRWSKLQSSHELYDAGHLFEAAVAHYLATGKRSLLNVALKNADLLLSVFGPDKLRLPPGHEEVELGLVKLSRVTGDDRYLNLAKFFLDERGHADGGRLLWGEYAQDHKPILEQEELVGHAVRALYMCSAITDIVALTGDRNYSAAVDRLWHNLVGAKLYITGGVGAENFGESIGEDFDLPNMSAYCETCASIANVLFNERMFLLHGDGRYVDVLERTLYNALLSGVSMSGDRFFYPNPLASRGQHERSPWFECACCPTNMARFIPSVPGLVYAVTGDSVFVNLYAANDAVVVLGSLSVALSQTTRYPWDGRVGIMVNPDRPARFSVLVRIPGWASDQATPGGLYRFADRPADAVNLSLSGMNIPVTPSNGYVCIQRVWRKGDLIDLNLPMPVRRLKADAKVEADSGRVALQRGPIVFCAEWPDNAGSHVLNIVLPDTARLHAEFDSKMLNGVETIRGNAFGARFARAGRAPVLEVQPFVAIPCYAWAHRGAGEMEVWIADEITASQPLDGSPIAATSKVTSSGANDVLTVRVNEAAPGPADQRAAFLRWSPRADTVWVQYDFRKREEVSEVDVEWLDDGGACRVPSSWRVLARVNGKWEPVWTPQNVWGVEKGKLNKVVFETSRTDALRLEAHPQPGYDAGVVEWRVY